MCYSVHRLTVGNTKKRKTVTEARERDRQTRADQGRIVLGNNMLRQTRAQTEQTLQVTRRNVDFNWKYTEPQKVL